MKVLLASSLALALMTGSVLAQRAAPAPAGMAQATPPVASAPAPDEDGMVPPPPPGGPRAAAPLPGGPGGPSMMADRGPDGRRVPPPPPPRGAHIDLQRGDLHVEVKCAEEETTKTCADSAMQMLDHLQAAPRAQ
ncbi:MAG: hypothetical protein ACRYGP_00900 [Janthinobacterium lividum]